MSSIQKDLNSFLSKVEGGEYSIQAATKDACTQARAKLKPETFIELNQTAVRDFMKALLLHLESIQVNGF